MASSPNRLIETIVYRRTPQCVMLRSVSWFTAMPGCETVILAVCRRCLTWEPLADSDPALLAAWSTEHRCRGNNDAKSPWDDLLDGWSAG